MITLEFDKRTHSDARSAK